jgi:HD-like signal output (HDOD) protein/GGDEF domain-containing protein
LRYTPLLLHFVEPAIMNDVTSRVEQIASRAAALYSRPTVALEIVRLTSEPQVDPRVLKDLLEKDPALTCKILRVVNSSFFGLRCEVANLNQALNVLGNKPLRLLVLGFSLPDELFAEMAAEQLEWYWRTTLTRAVAARQLATELWGELGDEAFIVGLMHDIGILALLRELGQPYAKLLSRVIEQRSDLAALERDSLGFDHVELSAALMKHWHLPQRLIDAVAAPKQKDRLERAISVDAELARILHLADLLAQLVGQRRVEVLPELLEAGGAYRDLTKGRLMVVVEKLQPQVEQLAEVLSVELSGEQNYVEALVSAHDQMASLTEELAGQLRHHRSEDEVYTELLQEAQELTFAMQSFLEGKDQCDEMAGGDRQWNNWHAPHERTQGEQAAAESCSENAVGIVALLKHLSSALPLCRARRQELSLLLMEANGANLLATADNDAIAHVQRALEQSCKARIGGGIDVLSITAAQLAVILPDCERRAAVSIANEVIAQLAELASHDDSTTAIHAATLSAGVATVAAVPKNFDPWRLVESAERCLYAARTCNANAVKSIEI